jgi:hypothetical protein
MPSLLTPQRRVIGGRAVVNRDWIRKFTGASVGTAARWYKVRDEQPKELQDSDRRRTGDKLGKAGRRTGP